jgi:hypothetical protein
MSVLTANTLLELWEQARVQPPGHRALTLLVHCGGISVEDAEVLSVGRRDRVLIAARQSLFGRRVHSWADCPSCGEMLELDLDLSDLMTSTARESGATLRVDRFEVEWRLPNAGDLAAVSRFASNDAARDELLRRCVLAVRPAEGEGELSRESWPDRVLTAVEAAMAEADPGADLRIDLNCLNCHHRWEIAFDIATFLWSELEVLAQQVLGEVHRLALAYGWHESDILGMSALRRAAYLEMCGG